jgi:hypothetical protein
MPAPRFEILDVNCRPIEACMRLPLNPAFYASFTTVFHKSELRVFQMRPDGSSDDVTHVFLPESPNPAPTSANLQRLLACFPSTR